MYDHVLMSGPWVRGNGERPTRMVLHAFCDKGEPVEFVVHMQYKDEEGHLHYESGNYFIVSHYDDAFSRAMDKFIERSRAHYHRGRKFLHLDEPDDELLATLASDPNEDRRKGNLPNP